MNEHERVTEFARQWRLQMERPLGRSGPGPTIYRIWFDMGAEEAVLTVDDLESVLRSAR